MTDPRLGDGSEREPPPISTGGPRRSVTLIAGLGAVLAVFVLPIFLLKLGLLLGGIVAVGYGTLGRDQARTIGPGLVVATFAIGISLVIGEFAVRIILSDVTTTGDNSNFFAQRWRSGLPAENSLGFREEEVSPEPSEGTYRIAVIGDSFTWGQGIARSDRWTDQLEDLLRPSAPNLEVLNFGAPGRNTPDHVETLRDVVLDLDPSFVLMQWYMNDVEDRRDPSGRSTFLPLLPSGTAARWLDRHSALYYLVDLQWRNLQTNLRSSSLQDEFDRRFLDPRSLDVIAAQVAMKEFIMTARQAGVDIGIVAFPEMEATDSIDDFSKGYLIERVMNLCSAEELRCLDLRETLVGVPVEELHVNRFDLHPGPLPNRLAAEALAEYFGDDWIAEANSLSATIR